MSSAIAKAGVLFGRITQATLILLAILLLAGSIMAGVNVISFAAIGVFALVLLGFVGVVEGMVRMVRGYATDE